MKNKNVLYKMHKIVLVQILLLVTICSNSCASEHLPLNTSSSEKSQRSPLTVDEYNSGTYSAQEFDGSWAPGSDHLIQVKTDTNASFYSVKTGKNETILQFEEINNDWTMDIAEVTLSSDLAYALIKSVNSAEISVTPKAGYLIYDVKTKNTTELGPLIPVGDRLNLQLIQFTQWTPTGNGIVYVANNNIFFRPNAHKNTTIRQITFDGSEKSWVFNGITAWHVRDGDSADDLQSLWISPSSKYLAYLKYNDSQIPEIQFPVYGDPDQSESVYPKYRKIRYPMAGFNISIVDVYIVSLTDENSKPIKMNFTDSNEKDRSISGSAYWCTDDKFLFPTYNRQQTTGIWHLCQVKSATCKPIYSYTFTHGWIDDMSADVSKDGSQFVFMRPVQLENESWSYNRIVLVSENGTEKVLSKGNQSVVQILGWDHEHNEIYYKATFWNGSLADPTESHLYTLNVDNSHIKCITCGLKNSKGQLCRSNLVDISENYTHFIHTCNGPDIPEITTRYMKTGKPVEHPGPTEINNDELRNVLKHKMVPTVKEYTVPIKGGFEARAKVYFPENLDPNKKYPLLVSVYAGPDSQSCNQAYDPSWEKTLVSRKNVIVATIDGRGSGRQSSDLLFAVHRQLGSAEVEDQIAVTKWLLQNEPVIDPNKTSIWGWSYGGYATAKVLETDTENIFKCGISMAPVTDWKHYLAIYSNCYMGMPTDNLEGYNKSRITSEEQVENFRNKEFLLIHGTGDSRVHYQNSMLLARALQKSGIMFQQMSYPDEGHSLSEDVTKHFYSSMEQFLFKTCYKMPELVD